MFDQADILEGIAKMQEAAERATAKSAEANEQEKVPCTVDSTPLDSREKSTLIGRYP